MGKVTKPPPTHHRHLPYPVTTSPRVMGPHGATAPPATTHRPMTPPQGGVDRHGSNTWNAEMDERLMRARQQNLNWGPIAGLFVDKTANACRKRHERLMAQRQNSGDWDATKMDALAKAYLDVRQEMWQVLANRVGEKWSTVEAKCMEKGLKTLTTSGRTARRREGQPHQFSSSDCDDDFYSVFKEHGRSRPTSEDGFTESISDEHHPFHRNSDDPLLPHPRHQTPLQHPQHHSSHPSPIQRTPPFPTPNRTFSISSSVSSSLTPITTSAPSFPSQFAHSRQSPSQQSSNTLPSFSSTFNLPSISNAIRPPVTTVN